MNRLSLFIADTNGQLIATHCQLTDTHMQTIPPLLQLIATQ